MIKKSSSPNLVFPCSISSMCFCSLESENFDIRYTSFIFSIIFCINMFLVLFGRYFHCRFCVSKVLHFNPFKFCSGTIANHIEQFGFMYLLILCAQFPGEQTCPEIRDLSRNKGLFLRYGATGGDGISGRVLLFLDASWYFCTRS